MPKQQPKKKKVGYAEPVKIKNPFEPETKKGEIVPAKKTEKPVKQEPVNAPALKQAKRPAAAITPTEHMRNLLNRMPNMDVEDEVSDEEAMANATTRDTTCLPNYSIMPKQTRDDLATVNTALATNNVEPEWYAIPNLPGYMAKMVRFMGRGIFKMFTRTRLEDISVIACVAGQGPNSPAELNSVAQWLKKNAIYKGTGEIGFGDLLPGYKPTGHEFQTGNTRFLVLKDDFGQYIYAFPEKDAVDLKTQST